MLGISTIILLAIVVLSVEGVAGTGLGFKPLPVLIIAYYATEVIQYL